MDAFLDMDDDSDTSVSSMKNSILLDITAVEEARQRDESVQRVGQLLSFHSPCPQSPAGKVTQRSLNMIFKDLPPTALTYNLHHTRWAEVHLPSSLRTTLNQVLQALVKTSCLPVAPWTAGPQPTNCELTDYVI